MKETCSCIPKDGTQKKGATKQPCKPGKEKTQTGGASQRRVL